MRKARASRRSHKQIGANNSVTDNGTMTQANSISSPSLRHFVSFEESLPSTTVADIKKGVTFCDNTVDTDIDISAGIDSSSIRFGSETGGVGVTTQAWDAPGTDDWLFFAVIRAIEDPSTPGNGYACYIEIGGKDIGIFPYMMRFEDIDGTGTSRPVYTKDLEGNWNYAFNGLPDPGIPSASFGGWWCDNCTGWNLVDGEVYSIGGCKRGDWLEHYFDGQLVGRINVAEFAEGNGFSTGKWDNWTPANDLETSHSGYSGVGCNDSEVVSTIGHWPSEYYGLMMSIFADGTPDDIEEAMQWMKTQWLAGNKVVWPGWVSLL